MLRLDPTDPRKTKVQTRDGREAEIYALKGDRLIGSLEQAPGSWTSFDWHISGRWSKESTERCSDLVNAPEPPVTEERWVMLYRDGTGYYVTLSKRAPDQIPDADRIAAKKIEITFTPGVFE